MITAPGDRLCRLQEVFVYHVESGLVQTLLPANQHQNPTQPHVARNGILLRNAAEELQNLGISEIYVCFLSLVPLAHVAWAADGFGLAGTSRILEAVSRRGLTPDSDAYRVLKLWLQARPERSLFDVWCDYVGALARVMTDSGFGSLRTSIESAAAAVAVATAGGFGLLAGPPRQNAALRQIAEAFELT